MEKDAHLITNDQTFHRISSSLHLQHLQQVTDYRANEEGGPALDPTGRSSAVACAISSGPSRSKVRPPVRSESDNAERGMTACVHRVHRTVDPRLHALDHEHFPIPLKVLPSTRLMNLTVKVYLNVELVPSLMHRDALG